MNDYFTISCLIKIGIVAGIMAFVGALLTTFLHIMIGRKLIINCKEKWKDTFGYEYYEYKQGRPK